MRRIFDMRAAGTTFSQIAFSLNEAGILSPKALYYQRKGQNVPERDQKWVGATVKRILTSEAYIGNMVQGKRGTLSYKCRQLKAKPQEDWIRVERTHDPLISLDVWDTVTGINQKRVRKSPTSDGIKSIFTGLVYCADCGARMSNRVERFTYKDGRPGRYSSFLCSTYVSKGKSVCSTHQVYENVLTQLVLTDIREKAQCAVYDRDRLLEKIVHMKDTQLRDQAASYDKQLKAISVRVAELEKLMQNLYEDKCAGVVSQAVFQTLMQKYEAERAQKTAALPELERKAQVQAESYHGADRWMKIIQRYEEITELDESILFELVDRIEVGEGHKHLGTRVQNVKIFYRYVGCVDDALAQEGREAV